MKNLRYDTLADLRFEDGRSRDVFNTIFDHRVFRDDRVLIERIAAFGGKWRCLEIERAMRTRGYSKLCLYGAGFDGRINKTAMDMCGIPVLRIYDSNAALAGTFIGNTVIAPKEELLTDPDGDSLVVISSKTYCAEIREDLLRGGIPEKRLLIPENGNLFAWSPDQYFDVFSPGEDEVFVDGGSFNGDTAGQFIKWCGGRFRKLFLIEPIEENLRAIRERFEGDSRITYAACALWDRPAQLSFFLNGDSSRIDSEAVYAKEQCSFTEGRKLDDIVGDEKVTFIKLDVEGSETEALRGAEQTIRRWHPRLAVSVYHKERDIIDIPSYIHEAYPEYRLWLRHYSSSTLETVLYASL